MGGKVNSQQNTGGSGTGGGSSGHDYSYTNPKDYPNDPMGRCVAPNRNTGRRK